MFQKKHRVSIFTLALCSALFSFYTSAAISEKISIPHLKSKVTFDGELNEPVWQQAQQFNLNIVNYPYDNTQSPVSTKAYMFEDGEQIYIAFDAKDPEPEKIQGFLRDRDDAFSDDIVGIKIDTFNNDRLAYKFFVNPYGVQNDGISNEMTGDDSSLWDAIWTSYGKVNKNGYKVEFAIPYSELNFEEGSDLKTWKIELIRIYPRDNILRISNIPLDRDNSCWVCQMQEIEGFKNAKVGQNVLVTPTIVAKREEQRDVYTTNDWEHDNDTDVGINLRWGITPDVMLNATINPDFSTVESDAGQLSVNRKYALFYDEKRSFFLDNSEYFSSPMDLIYTRNIADPDYGTKLTGRLEEHSFGFFMAKDNLTNIILPGNLFSLIDSINDESYSGALRYRFDANESLSIGAISTFRASSDYHNYVVGADLKYRIDNSQTIEAQLLTSATEYPMELYEQWCPTINTAEERCYIASMIGKDDGEFTDQTFLLDYKFETDNWFFDIDYEEVGEDFRADLGYMPKVDTKTFGSGLNHSVYSDEDWWTKLIFGAEYEIMHNTDDELIEKTNSVFIASEAYWQSFIELMFTDKDSVGLREDSNNRRIDNNTTLFDQQTVSLYFSVQPKNNLYMSFNGVYGDGIDYDNDRLGDIVEVSPQLIWNINSHLEWNISHTFAELEHDNDYVYRENITDSRLTYQFDVNSYLRLTMVYSQTDYNLSNNPNDYIDSQFENHLATQLIYSYQLNPQTVFFLGYQDNSIEDDYIDDLKQNERTAFLKLSYAIR